MAGQSTGIRGLTLSILILDENINPSLRKELIGRGITTETLKRLDLLKAKDDFLLEKLAQNFQNRKETWVLVTCDSKMPDEHRSAIRRTGARIAVLKGAGGSDSEQRDRVHRWAHRIAVQPPQTVRLYFKNRVMRAT